MRSALTRRSFVVVAGLAALSGSEALAATEDELAWLRLSASAELVAEALCTIAARTKALSRGERTDQLTPFWG